MRRTTLSHRRVRQVRRGRGGPGQLPHLLLLTAPVGAVGAGRTSGGQRGRTLEPPLQPWSSNVRQQQQQQQSPGTSSSNSVTPAPAPRRPPPAAAGASSATPEVAGSNPGSDVFIKGLGQYLRELQYGSTSFSRLWQRLEEVSGEPVQVMMDTWTLRR